MEVLLNGNSQLLAAVSIISIIPEPVIANKSWGLSIMKFSIPPLAKTLAATIPLRAITSGVINRYRARSRLLFISLNY